MKRTWQPKKLKRLRKLGFRARSKNSPNVLAKRRSKGRKSLSASDEFRIMDKKPVEQMR